MIQTVVARTKDLFDSEESPAGEESEEESSEPGDDVTTTIYSCERCDRTYVSEEMDTCSRCGESVEAVPNKYDLGLH